VEIAPGLLQIRATSGAKLLNLYAMVGEDGVALLDTGLAGHPAEAIAPELERAGYALNQVRLIVNTHADADHHGGNAAVLANAPEARVMAHRLDQPLIERADALFQLRYNQFAADHGIAYSVEVLNWLRANVGADTLVDVALDGGEILRVPGGDHVEVYHIPGHTWGHLLLWDPRRRFAFIGDGILGRGEYSLDGKLFAPPTYLTVEGYLGGIGLLRALRPSMILRCHTEVITGGEIDTFLSQSTEWVRECEAAVLSLVSASPGVCLAELIMLVNERLGPYVVDLDLAYAVSAHLHHLVRLGRLVERYVDGRVRWWPA
jgi:glyoxylase-like metal-dependent hydrolase (beta-lactamase superfamily II)